MKPENGHWYTPQGEPAHWQPKVDGSGTTPTTIRHARKLGLFPSVTTVLNALDKPALRNWLIRQAVMAVVTAPDVPGENLDAKITRILDTEQQQDQEAQLARDRGKDIHAALEAAFRGQWGAVPAGMMPWILPAYETLSKHGTVLETEFILVGEGYAGQCDLSLQDKQATQVEILVDFKSTGNLPKKASWMEHRLQLAAYARARALRRWPQLRNCIDVPMETIQTVNCYISTKEQEKGQFAIHANPPWKDDYTNGFLPLFQVWQHMNDYRPGQ